jgi:hypothetical protein
VGLFSAENRCLIPQAQPFFLFFAGFLADGLAEAFRFEPAAGLAPNAVSQFAENFLLGAERTIGPDMFSGSFESLSSGEIENPLNRSQF